MSSDPALQSNFSSTCYRSHKKIIRHLVHRRYSKKPNHHIQTIDSVSKMNPSTSTHNIPTLLSSSSAPVTTTTTTTNDRQQSLRTIRIWFQSLSLGHVVQRFSQHSHRNNTLSNKQNIIHHHSAGLRKFSELLY